MASKVACAVLMLLLVATLQTSHRCGVRLCNQLWTLRVVNNLKGGQATGVTTVAQTSSL